MVRTYDPDRPVPPALVERLLRHAVRAPSAGFSQGWDFVVLSSAQERDAFWASAADRNGVSEAPTTEPADPDGATTATRGSADGWLARMRSAPLLIICLSHAQAYLDRYAEPDKAARDPGFAARDPARWPVPYWDVDTGMAALLMLLTAVDEGLGGCFFGVPPERHDAVRRRFGVPPDRGLVGVVSIGYPAADRRSPSLRRGRRPLAEVAHAGHFGLPLPS